MSMTLKDLINLDEAAKLLEINKETLLRAIRVKELEAFKLGYGYKVTEAALEKWVQSKKNTAVAEKQGA